QGLGSNHGLSYAPYLTPMSHGMGLVPTEMLSSTPVIVPGTHPPRRNLCARTSL
ncbi:hypothetical protein M9458_002362, partial [Cirrhinus mrigala]